MNPSKTGEFISIVRKEKNLTQKELAKQLNVSDKKISRWETGKGYPDIEMLPQLSEVLCVSINELLIGNFCDDENKNNNVDLSVLELFKVSCKKEYKRILKSALLALIIGSSVYIGIASLFSNVFFIIVTLVSCILVCFGYFKYSKKTLLNSMIIVLEIIGNIGFCCFYIFAYSKFTPPDIINFVFVLCSLVFLLPLIIDISLFDLKN